MRMSVTVPPDVTRTTHHAHDPDALGEVERLSGRTLYFAEAAGQRRLRRAASTCGSPRAPSQSSSAG